MSGIAKRVTRLSDGRELIYFDDADTALRPIGIPLEICGAGLIDLGD